MLAYRIENFCEKNPKTFESYSNLAADVISWIYIEVFAYGHLEGVIRVGLESILGACIQDWNLGLEPPWNNWKLLESSFVYNFYILTLFLVLLKGDVWNFLRFAWESI